MSSKKKLTELIWEMPEQLHGLGLAMSTIGEYMRGSSWIERFHAERGATCFDRNIMTEYPVKIAA